MASRIGAVPTYDAVLRRVRSVLQCLEQDVRRIKEEEAVEVAPSTVKSEESGGDDQREDPRANEAQSGSETNAEDKQEEDNTSDRLREARRRLKHAQTTAESVQKELDMAIAQKTVSHSCDECERAIADTEVRLSLMDHDDYDVCMDCAAKVAPTEERDPSEFRPYWEARELKSWYAPMQVSMRVMQAVVECSSTTYAHSLEAMFDAWCKRPAMGYRPYIAPASRGERTGDGADERPTLSEEYNFISFEELRARVVSLARGLREQCGVMSGQFIGICGANCLEWYLCDLALMYLGAVVVPIHHSLDLHSLKHVLSNSGCRGVLCGAPQTSMFEKVAKDLDFVTVFRSFGLVCPETWEEAKLSAERTCSAFASLECVRETSCNVFSFEDLIEKDWCSAEQCNAFVEMLENEWEKERLLSERESVEQGAAEVRGPLVTLIYTSGSTGMPKAARIDTRLWVAFAAEGLGMGDKPHVVYSKDALSHISEREDVHFSLHTGARIGITSGPEHSFEDIRSLNPSHLSCTPRFWNVLYGQYTAKLESALREFRTSFIQEHRGSLKRSLTDVEALDLALAEEDVKAKVLQSFRSALGTRIRSIGTGGAATSPAVKEFLIGVFGRGRVAEGYACSEAGQLAGDDGTVHGNVKFKLVDVPELGYFQTDKPYPRGEFCCKTPTTITGYHKNPEATKASFDDEGFFHTGDIVEQIGVRKIRIIDRRKNFFKLSQGEFVAPEKVENVYVESPFVSQVYVTCANLQRYVQNAVLAVIVPDKTVLLKYASDACLPVDASGDIASLCRMKEVREQIVRDVHRISREERLPAHEMLRDCILEPEPFSVENGKMTASFKLARPVLKRIYQERIDALAEELASVTPQARQDVDPFYICLAEVMGVPLSHIDGSMTFGELGGDSLCAVQMVTKVEEAFSVSPPISFFFNKAWSVADLSHRIAALSGGAVPHQVNARQEEQQDASIDSSQWRMSSLGGIDAMSTTTLGLQMESDAVLDDALWQDAPTGITTSPAAGRGVLLTGATGFVGAFLLNELLHCGKYDRVYCLVRCSSQAHGRTRLLSNLRYFKRLEALEERYGDALQNMIIPIKGNLGDKFFGRTAQQFSALASDISAIYHNGAVVNHVLPYEHHKSANVDGTKEIIRLAGWLVGSHVHINYVSTIGVIQERSGVLAAENTLVSEEKNYHVSSGSSSGYEQSKWVSEMLFAQLHKHEYDRACTYTIFRPGMISWDPESGRGNMSDWLHRLLYGILELGSAPLTNGYLNIVPVTFIAQFIVYAGELAKGKNGQGPYHLLNCNRSSPVVPITMLFMWMSVHAGRCESSYEEESQERAFLRKVGVVSEKALPFSSWRKYAFRELQRSKVKPGLEKRHERLAGLALFSDGLPDDSVEGHATTNTALLLSDATFHCPRVSEVHAKSFVLNAVDVFCGK